MHKNKMISFAPVCLLLCLLSPVGAHAENHRSGRSASCPQSQTSASPKNLVETAVGAGNFMTLVKAVQAAGLVETLQGPGPFTVLAPTDAAFGKLDRATLRSLLQPKNRAMLTRILAYHVIPGNLSSSDVIELNGAKTLAGGLVRFSGSGNRVHINDARLLQADITASNGTIHVIDNVLLPE